MLLHVMALVYKCFYWSNGIRRSSEPRHEYIASLKGGVRLPPGKHIPLPFQFWSYRYTETTRPALSRHDGGHLWVLVLASARCSCFCALSCRWSEGGSGHPHGLMVCTCEAVQLFLCPLVPMVKGSGQLQLPFLKNQLRCRHRHRSFICSRSQRSSCKHIQHRTVSCHTRMIPLAHCAAANPEVWWEHRCSQYCPGLSVLPPLFMSTHIAVVRIRTLSCRSTFSIYSFTAQGAVGNA